MSHMKTLDHVPAHARHILTARPSSGHWATPAALHRLKQSQSGYTTDTARHGRATGRVTRRPMTQRRAAYPVCQAEVSRRLLQTRHNCGAEIADSGSQGSDACWTAEVGQRLVELRNARQLADRRRQVDAKHLLSRSGKWVHGRPALLSSCTGEQAIPSK